jgi:hypothetical protein
VNEPGSSVPEKLNSFPEAGAVRKEPRNLKDGGRELIGGWDVGCGSPSELDRRARTYWVWPSIVSHADLLLNGVAVKKRVHLVRS